jgi:iron complex outermembrane recepter protein
METNVGMGKPRVLKSHLSALLLAGSLVASPAAAQVLQPDFMQLNMEELLDLEVTSVSRKPQKVSDAAAAVFVITQQEIRRSGATSVPDVLRMVPGLHVARLDVNKWVVTSRGFSSVYANKLLVLVDGRTIYNQLFSGVMWQSHDVPLEDIERIEVIRGPGASIWGVNAVNGVINIITKRAADTHGILITATGGVQVPNGGFVRYGDGTPDELAYRVYAKYVDQPGSTSRTGKPAADDWDLGSSGFRIDWNASSRNTLSLSGDLFRSHGGEITRLVTSVIPPSQREFESNSRTSGGSLLAQWTDRRSDDSETAVQFFFDEQNFRQAVTAEKRKTFDIDFKHMRRFSAHELIWGGNYRGSTGRTPESGYVVLFNPAVRQDHLFSTFVQDEVPVAGERLRLTVGSRLDYSNRDGVDFQPNARALWALSKNQAVWFGFSKAERTPSRLESDVQGIGSLVSPSSNPQRLPGVLTYSGGKDLPSESLKAHEVGYRRQIAKAVSLDLAGFYNVYSELLTYERQTPRVEVSNSLPYLNFPYTFASLGHGESYGVEASADARIRRIWRVSGYYSLLKLQLHLAPQSTDVVSEWAERQSPAHQFQVRSSVDLSRTVEADVAYRYTGALAALRVPGYTDVDARIAWKLSPNVEVALAGQNLFNRGHLEFAPNTLDGMTQASLVKRSGYSKISWRF